MLLARLMLFFVVNQLHCVSASERGSNPEVWKMRNCVLEAVMSCVSVFSQTKRSSHLSLGRVLSLGPGAGPRARPGLDPLMFLPLVLFGSLKTRSVITP